MLQMGTVVVQGFFSDIQCLIWQSSCVIDEETSNIGNGDVAKITHSTTFAISAVTSSI